jgi:DMSO/TMAO reductase YedYZ molybdopterin-dependent catalytic subunit
VAGLALWQANGLLLRVLDLPGARRRFTGSYETGSFTGDFPTVSWLFDKPGRVGTGDWRLTVDGAVREPIELDYAEVEALAVAEQTALLDCTGGWYSTQVWRGIPLAALLDRAGVEGGARSITVEAVSGYDRRFNLDEARGFLLATAVAGNTLSHGHGFPLRLVAPDHRGFDWVKWVKAIHINGSSEFLQPPFPLQ